MLAIVVWNLRFPLVHVPFLLLSQFLQMDQQMAEVVED
jgi:hypothetical protein